MRTRPFRRVITSAAAVVLILAVTACSDDGGGDRADRTTTSFVPPKAEDLGFDRLLGADSQFAGFRDLMEVADYSSTFDDGAKYTLLVPDTSAIDALGEETLTRLRSGPSEELTALLGLHVLPGEVTLADLAATAPEGVETLSGVRLAVAPEAGTVRVGGALVVKHDIRSKAGVIHVLESVATPET